ncbi:MAG: DUF2284 domain-containing protein [Desulfosporosinus sp.]|nr:DUF2284 domain-containing protein [Desulfosporosinus sp.]
MSAIEKIIFREKESLNIQEYAFIKSSQIVFSDEVRMLCEKNACGMYGTSWACPPAVGSVERCREICSGFENAFLFTSLTHLTNMYNVKGWLEARIIHEEITDRVTQVFHAEFRNILTLSTEGCTVCKTCTYPAKPCRFPERMYPATEGFGILVTQLAQICNVKYNNGPNSLTYFSMILYGG